MGLIKREFMPARIQELGKIKIGGLGEERQKQDGTGTYQLPKKYDHFVVTTRTRGADGNFVRDRAIHTTVGEEPTQLDAVLMFPEVEENFHSEMSVYKGRTKAWECDGVDATNLTDGSTGACRRNPDGSGCECKPHSRLHLQLLASPNMEGYHVFRTTSWESTNNIQSTLERLYGHFGSLLGLPVRLVAYPAQVSYTAGGVVKTSNATMVGLTLGMTFEEAARLMVARQDSLQATREFVKRLAAEVGEQQRQADHDEAEGIRREFYPTREPARLTSGSVIVPDDPEAVAARLAARFGGGTASDTDAPPADATGTPPADRGDAPTPAPDHDGVEATEAAQADTDGPEANQPPAPEVGTGPPPDDADPFEPSPPAADSLRRQLAVLRENARKKDLDGYQRMAEQATHALTVGTHDLVEAAIKELSYALVVARAEGEST